MHMASCSQDWLLLPIARTGPPGPQMSFSGDWGVRDVLLQCDWEIGQESHREGDIPDRHQSEHHLHVVRGHNRHIGFPAARGSPISMYSTASNLKVTAGHVTRNRAMWASIVS